MADKNPDPILITDIRGRDGGSPPLSLPNQRCLEALNVDWYRSSAGRRRRGATAISLSGGTAQTGVISSLSSFAPLGNQGNRELWAVDDAATPRWKRLTGGTTWADVTVSDACQGTPWEIQPVYFNRKLHFPYHSNVDRGHLWDVDTAEFRRSGLPMADDPSPANNGAGSYAATLRYYKVRWVRMSGSVVTLAGELSDAVSFTPSGTGTGVRITQPTPPGEVETHWEVYGSADGSSYFRLAQVAEATTTYDDTEAPADYAGVAPPAVNTFLTIPSAKYLVADKKRLVGAGAYNPSAANVFTRSTRFWWTAPLGSTDNGDDERVRNTSTIKDYDDIEEDINGLGGPIDGSIFIFSYNGVWKAANTGLDVSPYVTQRLSGALGTIHHRTIVVAEDENGTSCLYWLSPVGPVRYGQGGFFHCHDDIADIWDTVNLSAAKPPHGVFHRDIHQIWWFVATGSSNECDTRIVFDTNLGRVVEFQGIIGIRGGWAKHTGPSAAARCSCLMSATLGATMSVPLKPYIGLSGSTAIWKCDTGTTDNGTAYQSYVESKPYLPWGLKKKGGMPEEAVLAARVSTGTTVSVTVIKDRGKESNPVVGAALLTSEGGSQAQIIRRVEGSKFADARCVQFRIGDTSAVDADWNIDALLAEVVVDGTG